MQISESPHRKRFLVEAKNLFKGSLRWPCFHFVGSFGVGKFNAAFIDFLVLDNRPSGAVLDGFRQHLTQKYIEIEK